MIKYEWNRNELSLVLMCQNVILKYLLHLPPSKFSLMVTSESSTSLGRDSYSPINGLPY